MNNTTNAPILARVGEINTPFAEHYKVRHETFPDLYHVVMASSGNDYDLCSCRKRECVHVAQVRSYLALFLKIYATHVPQGDSDSKHTQTECWRFDHDGKCRHIPKRFIVERSPFSVTVHRDVAEAREWTQRRDSP